MKRWQQTATQLALERTPIKAAAMSGGSAVQAVLDRMYPGSHPDKMGAVSTSEEIRSRMLVELQVEVENLEQRLRAQWRHEDACKALAGLQSTMPAREDL